MNENPASSRAFRFPAESIPASATTTMSVTPCRSANALSTGMRVLVSALLPSNRWISSGNPPGSTRRPTWTCGSTRCSLLIPTRRSWSSFSAWQVQGRDLVHDHRCPPRTAGVGHTGLADSVAVVTSHAPVQAAEDRPQPRRGHADLVQDADRVGLGRRLDDPRQHQPLERLVADYVEPEPFVGAGQHVPQQPAAHPRDLRTGAYERLG